MGYEKFVNDFIEYFYKFDNTKTKVNKLKSALRRVVTDELPTRDNTEIFRIRDFANSDNLNINIIYKNIYCKQNKDKKLIVGTRYPCWRGGWEKISTDKFVSEQIDIFFHFASR